MWHPFPGFSGSVTSIAILGATFAICRLTKKHKFYNLGPGGDPKAYEPILNRYIRLAEFMIGAASGSIVLIIGSSALHKAGQLPWFYASPLILIAASVVFGICFMALQILTYENVSHGDQHSATEYALNETLGFSSLICFVGGYIWLIFAATNVSQGT